MNSLKTLLSLFFIAFNLIILNAQVKIGQGVTSPNDWVDYNTTGIYVDVDTKSCGFKTTPHYLVTLESVGNKGYHWYISGAPSLYNITPTGFRVYLRWTDAPSDLPTVGSLNFPNPLRASTAKDREWVIRWTGIEMTDCNPTNEQLGVVSQIFSGPNGAEVNKINPTEQQIESQEPVLFPNPGKDKIVIQYSGSIKKTEIYDLNSKLIGVSKTNSIDIQNLRQGSYFIKIYDDKGKITTKRFIK
ncbi:T9SS type A sorting domain-containing protein [Aquimarina sp. 2201CG5-10]|uniref:T9SS type A sorting domain-containing protein n=1 Tax=Aquimarina callyspongiae TaxID=3098150 RepID=UPI002AB45731|nr:T9SS type A sorting domain-containing protein [Aquimarina sp. 2201CG5-10]MDY8138181.1 T9SS type A sorting domain-containing protein [Aquimarina sp. 2201CG5-10]